MAWQQLGTDLNIAVQNLNAIANKIESGDGTMGMLLNDEQLYNEFTKSLAALQVVLTEFAQDPEVRLVLFGRKNKD